MTTEQLQKSHDSIYVTHLSGTDATFAKIRDKYYRKGTWFETAAGDLWDQGPIKAGPLTLSLISPALGYEARANVQACNRTLDQNDFSASLKALESSLSFKKADLIQFQALTQTEAQTLCDLAITHKLKAIQTPYHVRYLAGYASFEAYLQAHAGDQVKTLKRNQKKAASQGFVCENKLPPFDDILDLLDRRKSDFENGTVDYTADPNFRSFYRELLTALAAENRLYGFSMRTREGKLVSYAMGFSTGPVFHWYQTAYDAVHAKLGVGSISLASMIEQCFDHGLQIFDFMGDQNYFERWSHTRLELRRVTLQRPTLKGFAFGLYKKLRSQ